MAHRKSSPDCPNPLYSFNKSKKSTVAAVMEMSVGLREDTKEEVVGLVLAAGAARKSFIEATLERSSCVI